MKLDDGMIAEQFDTLLEGLGQEAVGLHLAVERRLAALGAPGVSWGMESGDTGFIRALAGRRRDLLCIDYDRLPEYRVLISARPFGSLLQVSWFLFVSPRIGKDIRRALRVGAEPGKRFEVGAELDLFDLSDLNAFVGATKLELRAAIRELTDVEPEVDDGVPSPRGLDAAGTE
jgi:hypothetical protein